MSALLESQFKPSAKIIPVAVKALREPKHGHGRVGLDPFCVVSSDSRLGKQDQAGPRPVIARTQLQ